nr:hypothetical protein [Pseudomonas lini]
MLSKKHVLTLAAAMSLLFVGAANAGAVLDKIQSSKTMTVATSATWPPQGFINDKNEIDGFSTSTFPRRSPSVSALRSSSSPPTGT